MIDSSTDIKAALRSRQRGFLLNPFRFSGGGSGGSTDPYFSNVTMLLHFDGADESTTFTDSSGAPKTVTPYGGAHISTAQSVFGGASLRLDGSGDYLAISPGAIDVTTEEDFTLEFFFRLNAYPANGSYALLLDKQVSSSERLTLYLGNNTSSDSGLLVAMNNIGTSKAGSEAGTHALSDLGFALNTWYHTVVCRALGASIRVYKSGVLLPQIGTYTGPISNAANIIIGAFNNGASLFFDGNIDELRFTKGVARYGSNFTPPSAPFPDA